MAGRPVAVGGHEAVRQIHNFLGVELAPVFWDHGFVCENVIEVRRAHRAGKAEIVHLDRCRPPHENTWTGICGEAHQIDQNIDLRIPNRFGDLVVAPITGVDEMLKRRLHPAAEI